MVSVRQALESLWQGVCTITIREGTQNPTTKRTEFTESNLHQNQPCKLSFERITVTDDSDNAASIAQATKLFIAPEINIPAGSKITVTQNGKTAAYEKSGEPAIYSNHQEVPLELFKGWA
jgi:hypothetical protein